MGRAGHQLLSQSRFRQNRWKGGVDGPGAGLFFIKRRLGVDDYLWLLYVLKARILFQTVFGLGWRIRLVAILAGLMIFPAVFAMGHTPDSGTGLAFTTLPAVFESMPAGWLVGAVFFLLLSVAAVTSSISMLEVPVSYFVDEKNSRRTTCAVIVGLLAFVDWHPLSHPVVGMSFSNITLFGQKGFFSISRSSFRNIGPYRNFINAEYLCGVGLETKEWHRGNNKGAIGLLSRCLAPSLPSIGLGVSS